MLCCDLDGDQLCRVRVAGVPDPVGILMRIARDAIAGLALVAVVGCAAGDTGTTESGSTEITSTASTAGATDNPDRLLIYEFKSGEPWPGGLVEGRLTFAGACLVIKPIGGGDVDPVAVPRGYRVEREGGTERLVAEAFDPIRLERPVSLGGGTLDPAAASQLGVDDPSACLGDGATLVLPP